MHDDIDHPLPFDPPHGYIHPATPVHELDTLVEAMGGPIDPGPAADWRTYVPAIVVDEPQVDLTG